MITMQRDRMGDGALHSVVAGAAGPLVQATARVRRGSCQIVGVSSILPS